MHARLAPHREHSRIGQAFTLVELLVVIGIIAVLIAILLPAISRAKAQANTTACAANLRSIGQAIKVYESEFSTYPFSLYTSNNANVGNRAAIDDGADDALSGATYTWWSVIRKVMRGGKGNWDNSVVNVDGSRSTRFMPAFNCPSGNNRDAGCDFVSNPIIMPEYRYETSTGAHAASPAFRARRLTRPAQSKSLFADNVVLADGAELAFGSDPFTRQYVCGYDLDDGRLMQAETIIGAQMRFRGLVAPAHPFADGTLVDPGPNTESDGATRGLIGQIRWRHGRNDTANFLLADSSVKSMRITTNYGQPTAKGELTRAMLRPKVYPGYRP